MRRQINAFSLHFKSLYLCCALVLIAGLTPLHVFAQDSFEKAFRRTALSANSPSSPNWAQFAVDQHLAQTPGAFDQLKPILIGLETPNDTTLVTDIQPAGQNHTNGDLFVNVMSGFQIFAKKDEKFRANIAAYAMTLRPAQKTLTTPIILKSLIFSCGFKENDPNSDSCKAAPTEVDLQVYKAIARHRAYVDFNDVIQKWLKQHTEIIANQSPDRYLIAFDYILAPAPAGAPKINDSDTSRWDVAALDQLKLWDVSFRQGVLDRLCAPGVVSGLGWDKMAGGESQLAYSQTALLDAYEDNSLPTEQDESGKALQRHLERACQLWSQAFASWQPVAAGAPGFDKSVAYRNEKQLRTSIQRLQDRHFLAPEAAKQYLTWVSLCGGWSDTTPNAPPSDPKPTWVRGWTSAASAGHPANLTILEGAAPDAFLHLQDKLTDIDATGHITPVQDTELTNPPRIVALGSELLTISKAQAVAPPKDFNGQAQTNGSLPDDDFLLPRTLHPRTATAAAINPDQRRALKTTLAAYYLWRADVAYRQAGCKILGQDLDADKVKAAQDYYTIAQALLPTPANSWTDGLGLFSRVLELQTAAINKECTFRLKQLDTSNGKLARDYFNDATDWSASYEGLSGFVDRTLLRVDQLQQAVQNGDVERDLNREVQIQTVLLAKADDLKQAATFTLEAENDARKALTIEQQQQQLRTDIAGHAVNEANLDVKAAQAALLGQTDLAGAHQALKDAADFEVGILEEQKKLLQQAVQQCQDGIQPLLEPNGGQLQTAKTEMQGFHDKAKAAYDANHQSSFWATFLSVVKPIASLVSIYFTGVDLVSIAESAFQAVQAARSGDWGSALTDVANAANVATKGKAGDYLKSLMPDSIKTAISTLQSKMPQLSGDDAASQAILVIGRRAAGLGVSYLADKTHMRSVAAELGVSVPQTTIDDLEQTSLQQATDAAYEALARQGPAVLEAAKSQLGAVNLDSLKSKLRAMVSQPEFETKIVKLINDIGSTPGTQADVAELKAQLIAARGVMVNVISQKLQKPGAAVEAALDKLNPIPVAGATEITVGGNHISVRVPLPDAVQTALSDFNTAAQTARAKVAFFASPDAVNNLAQQLGDAKDDNDFNTKLNTVQSQLQQNFDAAQSNVQTALAKLNVLKGQVDALDLNARKASYQQNSARLQAASSSDLIAEKDALVAKASESILLSQEQADVEKLGSDRITALLDQQNAVIGARQKELDAAGHDLDVAQYNLEAAKDKLGDWHYFNTEENANDRLSLRTLHRFYLDSASASLNQMFQLINLYEFDINQVIPATAQPKDFLPTYLIEDASRLKERKGFYDEAADLFKTKHPGSYHPMSSLFMSEIHISEVAHHDKLAQFAIPEGHHPQDDTLLRPSLHLQGPADLARLRRGFYFRIDRLRSDPLAATEAWDIPFRVSNQDQFKADGNFPVLYWDDEGIYRTRLVGVQLRILQGIIGAGKPILHFNQLNDGWTHYVNSNSSDAGAHVTLPLMVNGKNAPNVDLLNGEFIYGQIETRPLYGTYILTIDDSSYQKIDPVTFEATLDFLAAGVNQ